MQAVKAGPGRQGPPTGSTVSSGRPTKPRRATALGHDDDTDDNETGTKDERRNFGTTANGKVSGRFRFLRGSVSSGFRAPTPGQQNGFNIQSWFDPTVGDLVNNAVIPSISPVARLRGGRPLGPEQSINYTAGVVFVARVIEALFLREAGMRMGGRMVRARRSQLKL